MPINSDAYSRIMFERILETIPSLVKQEILTDSNMVRKWGVGVLTGMRLGTDGPGFERSTLYNAFRSIVDGPVLSVNLIDDEGRSWTVTVDRDDNGMLGFKVINGAVVYRLEDHSPLARDPTIRIAWLDRIADDLLPPSDWVANWRLELAATPLSDAAFVNLLEDVELMPSSVDRVIRAGLERRRADFHLFAPNKALYYNRLVGKLGTETTAAAYIDEVAGPMVEELVRRDGAAGIRRAFLVCGHGMIVARLPLASMAVDEVREVYEWLAVRGDPISRVAGVELWLANIAEYPGLEETVIRIVEAVLAEDDGEASPYAALSAVFSSSMGVMARQHLFEDAPPFFRRQAALAHASLVVRAMIDVGSDTSGIKRWLDETGSPQVAFLQALIDLRKEPRWLPEYASAAQLRAEMIGRLRVAAMMYSDGIVSEALTALLIGQNSTLGKAEGWLRPFLPGPLEGTSETIRPLTKEVLEEVRQAFAADELNASSFLDMVNFAYVSGDVAEVASLAADALKRLDHLVNTDGNDRTSFQALAALSIIASGARNKDLAEALRVLSRVKRRHGLFHDDPENEVRIVLIAGAAFEDCTLWASFVCEWITEICLTLETADRASNLIAILRRLRQLEPALLRYLSQSEAALSALESRS